MRNLSTIISTALFACALAALAPAAVAAPGDLDTRFGSGQGFLTTDVVPGNHDAANAVASDHLGRVWVAGTSFGSAASGGIAVTRYDSQGLDTSFASGGKRVIASGSDARGGGILERSNPVGPGLQVLIAGSVVEGGVRKPLVAAIRENGDLDPGWADDGLLSHPVPGASSTELTAIAEQAGRIVVAGHATMNDKVYAFVARYTATGELDPTFSSDGMRVMPAWRPYDAGTSVQSEAVIQDVVFDGSRNRIVLVGLDSRSGDVNALTIGLRSTDGATDTSWGDRGLGRVFAFGHGNDWFNAAELAYNGKLVLAGGRDIPGTGKAAVTARLDTKGRLDLSYGGGNGVTRWHPGRDLDATDLAITGAFIVVATHDSGGTGGSADDDTFTILRYRFNGDADLTWGPGNAEVRTNINPGTGGYERHGGRGRHRCARSDVPLPVRGRLLPQLLTGRCVSRRSRFDAQQRQRSNGGRFPDVSRPGIDRRQRGRPRCSPHVDGPLWMPGHKPIPGRCNGPAGLLERDRPPLEPAAVVLLGHRPDELHRLVPVRGVEDGAASVGADAAARLAKRPA